MFRKSVLVSIYHCHTLLDLIFSQNSQWPGRDSNQVPPKYKSETVSLDEPVKCLISNTTCHISSSKDYQY
jgi:hypothetical protein